MCCWNFAVFSVHETFSQCILSSEVMVVLWTQIDSELWADVRERLQIVPQDREDGAVVKLYISREGMRCEAKV